MKPMSEQMQQVAARYEKATGKKFDQMTNADHIRSMTDEELAAVISQKEGLVQFCRNKAKCEDALCAT